MFWTEERKGAPQKAGEWGERERVRVCVTEVWKEKGQHHVFLSYSSEVFLCGKHCYPLS